MNQFVFIISLIWKLSKGLDKKLLRSHFLRSLLKADSSKMEIIVPHKKITYSKNTLSYHDYLNSQKNKQKPVKPFFQLIFLQIVAFRQPVKLFLN